MANTTSKVDKMRFYHERNVRATSYAINDVVWLHNDKDGKAKLHKKWIGPYKVVDKINDLNYAIKHVNRRSRRLIVHINRLKRCFMRAEEERISTEPIVKIEDNTQRESQAQENNGTIAKNPGTKDSVEIQNVVPAKRGRAKGSKNGQSKKTLPPEKLSEDSIAHRLRTKRT